MTLEKCGKRAGEGSLEQLHDHPLGRHPAVTELKQKDGRELIMYGYGRLNQTLLENHLVDEIRFSVHPILVQQTLPLKLTGTTPSPSGVVALTYEPISS